MGTAAIRFREFVGHHCRRCGALMADHLIRPLHVPELPDVPAAEIVCPPMLVLDGTTEPYAYEGERR